jgi:hypothetical protein
MIANIQYGNDAATLGMDLSYQSGGGGGGSTSSSPSSTPASRTISFNVTSSPQGAAIIIDGINSGYTTPYTLQYSETQLLTPKTISLVNGSTNSSETYVLSAEMITTQIGTASGGGGSYGGGYSGGGGTSNNGMYETGLPFYQQQNIK